MINCLKTIIHIILGATLIFLSSCTSDSDDSLIIVAENDYALFITDGAISLKSGSNYQYTAAFVSSSSEVTTPNVSWSLETLAGDESIASISSNGQLTANAVGAAIVTATYEVNDITYSASVPLDIYTPGILTFIPGAIIAHVSEPPLQIENVYYALTGEVLNASYSSSNSNIASVSASGLISFVEAGQCVITATATNIDGSPSQTIPVLVYDDIASVLPVARIEVTPKSSTLFPGETLQFEAKIYDGNNKVVSDKQVTWNVISRDEDIDGLDLEVGTINSNGLFNATIYGRAQVVASVDGVSGTADVFVVPEFVIITDPLIASIAPGKTKQFTASVHAMNKETITLNQTPEPSPPAIKWDMPSIGGAFDIGSVDENGLVSINENAQPGLVGILDASAEDKSRYYSGGSIITVSTPSPDCDCGTADENANSLEVSQTTINLNLIGNSTAQINAQILDTSGNSISATIAYCSDNLQVAKVDDNGLVVGVLAGQATITVCHGNLSKDISINVSL